MEFTMTTPKHDSAADTPAVASGTPNFADLAGRTFVLALLDLHGKIPESLEARLVQLLKAEKIYDAQAIATAIGSSIDQDAHHAD